MTARSDTEALPADNPAVGLSEVELHVMEHATAWRHKQRLYRNHFVTGPGTADWPIVTALCERGLMVMTRKPSELSGGDPVFSVTEAGIAALEATAGPARRAP